MKTSELLSDFSLNENKKYYIKTSAIIQWNTQINNHKFAHYIFLAFSPFIHSSLLFYFFPMFCAPYCIWLDIHLFNFYILWHLQYVSQKFVPGSFAGSNPRTLHFTHNYMDGWTKLISEFKYESWTNDFNLLDGLAGDRLLRYIRVFECLVLFFNGTKIIIEIYIWYRWSQTRNVYINYFIPCIKFTVWNLATCSLKNI